MGRRSTPHLLLSLEDDTPLWVFEIYCVCAIIELHLTGTLRSTTTLHYAVMFVGPEQTADTVALFGPCLFDLFRDLCRHEFEFP